MNTHFKFTNYTIFSYHPSYIKIMLPTNITLRFKWRHKKYNSKFNKKYCITSVKTTHSQQFYRYGRTKYKLILLKNFQELYPEIQITAWQAILNNARHALKFLVFLIPQLFADHHVSRAKNKWKKKWGEIAWIWIKREDWVVLCLSHRKRIEQQKKTTKKKF